MEHRSRIAPQTLRVVLHEHGVEVRYLDGRSVLYHGVPRRQHEELVSPPGKETHVLVTDRTGTEGVMVYLNDRTTHDDIFRSTGVGRVILAPGEQTAVFPGVSVAGAAGDRVAITVDHAAVTGRVLAFIEDDWGEASYEFLPAAD
jgi:hypothetical protein